MKKNKILQLLLKEDLKKMISTYGVLLIIHIVLLLLLLLFISPKMLKSTESAIMFVEGSFCLMCCYFYLCYKSKGTEILKSIPVSNNLLISNYLIMIIIPFILPVVTLLFQENLLNFLEIFLLYPLYLNLIAIPLFIYFNNALKSLLLAFMILLIPFLVLVIFFDSYSYDIISREVILFFTFFVINIIVYKFLLKEINWRKIIINILISGFLANFSLFYDNSLFYLHSVKWEMNTLEKIQENEQKLLIAKDKIKITKLNKRLNKLKYWLPENHRINFLLSLLFILGSLLLCILIAWQTKLKYFTLNSLLVQSLFLIQFLFYGLMRDLELFLDLFKIDIAESNLFSVFNDSKVILIIIMILLVFKVSKIFLKKH